MNKLFAVFLLLPGFVFGGSNPMKPLKAGAFTITCSVRKEKTILSISALDKKKKKQTLVLTEQSDCDADGENLSVDMSSKKFKLAPGNEGVIVIEMAGGEAIGVNYYLVGWVDEKLKVLWTEDFGTQEMVSIDNSELNVTDKDKDGRDEIDYRERWTVTENLDRVKETLKEGTFEDEYVHQRLQYDDKQKKMVDVPFSEFAAILMSSKSLKEILETKVKLQTKCESLGEFMVLDTKTFKKLQPGEYLLAVITDSKEQAQLKLGGVQHCGTGIKPAIKTRVQQVR